MTDYKQQLIEANELLSGEEYEKALEIILPLVKIEVPGAIGMYGAMFQLGIGVKRDLTIAVELGDGTAAHNLGTIFIMGEEGIKKDLDKGKIYYRKAKELGAQYASDEFYE